jgi:hypothetical protein
MKKIKENMQFLKKKKIKEIMQFFECFLLNAMKNEENKGNNAIF